MTRLDRRGFSLVELMVAMVVASLVVILARAIFASAVDGIERLTDAARQMENQRLGMRWLESALLSLEVGPRGSDFEGGPDRLSFSGWTMREHGWLERERIEVEVKAGNLVAVTEHGQQVIQPEVQSVTFDYLLEPGLDSRWVTRWISPMSAPLAVRVRVGRTSQADTMLFLIKGRG